MEKKRFALVGCGRIAQRHAEHINNYGTLSAVCDIELIKAKKLGEKYNARYYSNIEEMLENENENIDVVTICSPNSSDLGSGILTNFSKNGCK